MGWWWEGRKVELMREVWVVVCIGWRGNGGGNNAWLVARYVSDEWTGMTSEGRRGYAGNIAILVDLGSWC